jgi:hypothetical protein
MSQNRHKIGGFWRAKIPFFCKKKEQKKAAPLFGSEF